MTGGLGHCDKCTGGLWPGHRLFSRFDDGRGRPGHIRAETTFLPLVTLSVQTLMTSIYDVIKGVTVGPQ